MTESEDALSLKQKGNQAFKDHDWLSSVHFYTKAIEANDQDPSFYANRAQVNSRSLAPMTLVSSYLRFSRQISNSRHMGTLSLTPPKPSSSMDHMSR